MLKPQNLSKLARAAFVATAFLASSSVANAYVNQQADPFLNQTIDLEAAAGTLIALPGTGPGGSTLYASDFYIGLFQAPTVTSDGNGGIINSYSAVFDVNFKNADGSAAIIPGTTTQGSAYLTGGIFTVDFLGRANQSATGTFTMNLLQAQFSGTTNLGTGLFVNLANIPSAQVSITAAGIAGYNINYLSNFVIQGQYFNNSNGTGAPIVTPVMGDSSQGGTPPAPPSTNIPEPAMLALLASGVLSMFGARRRRTAVAA